MKKFVIPAEAGIHFFVMIFLDSRFHGNDKCGAFSFLYSFLILMIIGFNWFSEFSVRKSFFGITFYKDSSIGIKI